MGCKTSKCVEYRFDGTEHTFQLHTAIQQCNYEEARHLILNGTNVNCINYIGATPLIETCRTSRLLGKQRERESFVRFLIRNGAQVDMNDITGGTAMYYATENELHSIVNILKRRTRGKCRGKHISKYL